MSNLLEKAVNNSIWTSIGSIGTAIIGFLFAGVTIRWLGEAEAGFVITINALLVINSNLSSLGLGSASIRLFSKAQSENDNEKIKKIAGVCLLNSLGFGFLGLLAFSFGSILIMEYSNYEGDFNFGLGYCILSGLSFLIINICSCFVTLITSVQRFDLQAILNISFGLLNGILGIICLQLFPNILTVGLVYLFTFLFKFILTIKFIKSIFSFIPIPCWDKETFLSLWDFGKWSYLESILRIFSFGLDKILVTFLFGAVNLPAYSLPQNIYLNIHNILNQQCNYLFPMLSNLNELNGVKVIEKIADHYRWFIGVISGLIYILLIVLGKSLLSGLVNSDFAEKAYINILIFSFIGFFHALGIINYQLSYAKGDSKSNFYYLYWNAIICLPVMFISGKLFGFNYVAMGQSALIFSTYFHYLRVYKLNFFSGLIPFLKIHFSALIALAFCIIVFFTYQHYLLVDSILTLSILTIFISIFYVSTIIIVEKMSNNFSERFGIIVLAVKLVYRKIKFYT